MAWTFGSVLNGIKNVALPVIGTALGGPVGGALGGALAGGIGNGRPRLGNMAGGAIGGAAGGMGAGAGGGSFLSNVGNFLKSPQGITAAAGLLGATSKPTYKTFQSTPSDITGLRGDLARYLQGQMTGGGLTPSATGAQAPGYDITNEVQSQNLSPAQQAAMAYMPPGVDPYAGLRNFQPNLQTQDAYFGGVGSAGMGNTGNYLQQLANFNGLGAGVDPRVQQALLGGNQVQAQQVGNLLPTQSVDQLGTGFAQSFMQNYNPLFEQQRQKALAQAKEASGNLTGSGFANALGNSTAQTLAQQQGQLANLAQFGIGQEMQRQGQAQQLDLQRGLGNAGNALQAAQGNQQAALQGAQAYGGLGIQGAGLNLDALRTALGGEQTNLAREQGRLTEQAGLQNQNALQNRGLTSQELQSRAQLGLQQQGQLAGFQGQDWQNQLARELQNNQFNAGQFNQQNQFGANLNQNLGLANRQQTAQERQFGQSQGQQNAQFNAGQQNQFGLQNANNLAELIRSMSTAGVGSPNTISQPGFGQQLAGFVGNALPYLFPNRGLQTGNSGINQTAQQYGYMNGVIGGGLNSPSPVGMASPGGTSTFGQNGVPAPAGFLPQPTMSLSSGAGGYGGYTPQEYVPNQNYLASAQGFTDALRNPMVGQNPLLGGLQNRYSFLNALPQMRVG